MGVDRREEETPEAGPATTGGVQQTAADHRQLLVFSGGGSWMYQLPSEGTVVIGRSEAADLQIDDVGVSRQHAKVVVRPEAMTIADLGSHNGTLVNRERVAGERTLASGDVIAIHQATIVVHCPAQRPAPSLILTMNGFRQRLEDELERAVRYEREFTVMVLMWPETPREPAAIERMLEQQLRRIDAACWVTDGTMYVLLAEAGAREAMAFVARVRGHLDPKVRIGHASCPSDGAELDALLASAGSAASGAALGQTTHTRRTHSTLTIGNRRVIVADPAVIRLYALIDRIARIPLPVLIVGETGCGKELAATAIHERSPRRARALVSINCAAIQESLVESELFGHEKGAFTGAVSTKTGHIEAAHGSTLFLDELGELSLAAQAKLLRVLEAKRFTRVGGVAEREVDVRIVAATNRDLEADITAGRFRQDLYFRLTGALLYLPPLRQRPKELPLLAAAFLDEACAAAGRPAMRIGDAAMTALANHAWPGNVRELKNLMQYVAAAFSDAELRPEHILERLGPRARSATGVIEPVAAERGPFRPLADEIRELEIARIRAALEATGGNQTRAAALLSVPIRTFSEKVKSYNIPARRRRNSLADD